MKIPVHYCGDCPFYSDEYGLCSETQNQVSTVGFPPMDCPLRADVLEIVKDWEDDYGY